jgi:hypothetical protein
LRAEREEIQAQEAGWGLGVRGSGVRDQDGSIDYGLLMIDYLGGSGGKVKIKEQKVKLQIKR